MSTATATGTATRPHARSEGPACAGPARSGPTRRGRTPQRLQPVPVQQAPVDRGRSRVHLTGRGRVLVLLALVALLLSAFAFGRSASHAAVTAESGGPTLTPMTVQPGDTLWSVSRRLAPHRDAREVVDQLQRLNHLSSSALQVGQQLLLPLAV